jgi:signal transduction histidine kinase/CheY-like chemotaxis protein
MDSAAEQKSGVMSRYLSPAAVWALSLGCTVGWGAFVMPGTVFLPAAGPLGSLLGLAAGGLLMLVIAFNYGFLIRRYPDNGGSMTYASKTFGYDHGFISSWFLILVYIAIIWANATAIPLIARYVAGDVFQVGFRYSVLGYDVYMGEALLSLTAILLCGFICRISKRLAVWLQTVGAFLLVLGIVTVFAAVLWHSSAASLSEVMTFSGGDETPFWQILSIFLLTPWAFVGFESVSNSAGEMKFDPRRVRSVLIVSVCTGTLTYMILAVLPALIYPGEFASLKDYLAALGAQEGLRGLPVFYAAEAALGQGGVFVISVAALCAIITGLIGNYIAASRLVFAMSDDGILPAWFGRLGARNTPENALLFLTLLSALIPLLGRSAIGWIVDVNTLGASVAYLYTSAAAFVLARREHLSRERTCGAAGMGIALMFGFCLMFFASDTIRTATYMILAIWSILGFAFFYYVFSHDQMHRFGKSTVSWIGLMLFVLLISLAWVKQSNDDETRQAVLNVAGYYHREGTLGEDRNLAAAEAFSEDQITATGTVHTRNSFIQLGMILISILFVFSIYATMNRRERDLKIQTMRAEESSRAKTHFLFNMSHDIRTPMNAILGFTRILINDGKTPPESLVHIRKIDTAGRQLLGIINNVLEMSRIESGRIGIHNGEHDFGQAIREVFDLFREPMEGKHIKYTMDTALIPDTMAVFDRDNLIRIIMNLISNACKFTGEGGAVYVFASQTPVSEDGASEYLISVRDNGPGIAADFLEKIFEPFERARTSTESGLSGTGLGLAVSKRIAEAMQGRIEVVSEPGKGAEFLVKLKLRVVRRELSDLKEEQNPGDDFFGKRILLAEDMEINREIAEMLLEDLGFVVEAAVNGREALIKYQSSAPGYYDAIITDIQMPIMDGYELTRAVRNLRDPGYAEIPIIAMTANAMQEDKDKALSMGMNGHVPKPLDVAVMTEVIGRALRGR